MTGFGRCRATVDGLDITVEIKSVNSRFMECNTKITRGFAYLEERVKPYLTSRGISRGKVDVWIGIEVLDTGNTEVTVDDGYLRGYLAALAQLRDGYGLRDDISVMSVARNAEIFRIKKPEEDVERDWEDLKQVLDAAAERFLESRSSEGKRIEDDLCAKIEYIKSLVSQIEERSGEDILGYRSRLEEKLKAVLADNNVTIDENRILTECAIYADRAAIDEEIVRLKSHFCAFYDYVNKSEPVGRSLDFLIQEMNREINTIGSKCGNSEIAHLVVECKTEMEKVREQIQNIE
jgi:uncharacterized protein (TIGR00255 family)